MFEWRKSSARDGCEVLWTAAWRPVLNLQGQTTLTGDNCLLCDAPLPPTAQRFALPPSVRPSVCPAVNIQSYCTKGVFDKRKNKKRTQSVCNNVVCLE